LGHASLIVFFIVSQDGRDGESRERLAALGEIAAEIAHELGNVLQVISGSAYVARQEALKGDPAACLPHVEKIERNARAAHAVVDDLMALARGDAIHAERVLLSELAATARADLAPARWDDSALPADLQIRAHPTLFVRLLHALYDNAIRASAPRAPMIATRAYAQSAGTVVEVADDGPGVPAHIAARLFEPLVSARPGGSGLGLALARRIATAHGGTIVLVEVDRGAMFRVEVPL
jgi:signal transduction histidine kinase